MPYSFEISHEAENNLLEAYRWYEEQQIDLGEDFLSELDKGIDSIVQNPKPTKSDTSEK